MNKFYTIKCYTHDYVIVNPEIVDNCSFSARYWHKTMREFTGRGTFHFKSTDSLRLIKDKKRIKQLEKILNG